MTTLRSFNQAIRSILKNEFLGSNYLFSFANFTLRRWLGSEPCFSRRAVTSRWPPAHANERTVESLLFVDRLTSAPMMNKIDKMKAKCCFPYLSKSNTVLYMYVQLERLSSMVFVLHFQFDRYVHRNWEESLLLQYVHFHMHTPKLKFVRV